VRNELAFSYLEELCSAVSAVHDHLKETYSTMFDGELIQLHAEIDELYPDAQKTLLAEIRKRGLRVDQPHKEPKQQSRLTPALREAIRRNFSPIANLEQVIDDLAADPKGLARHIFEAAKSSSLEDAERFCGSQPTPDTEPMVWQRPSNEGIFGKLRWELLCLHIAVSVTICLRNLRPRAQGQIVEGLCHDWVQAGITDWMGDCISVYLRAFDSRRECCEEFCERCCGSNNVPQLARVFESYIERAVSETHEALGRHGFTSPWRSWMYECWARLASEAERLSHFAQYTINQRYRAAYDEAGAALLSWGHPRPSSSLSPGTSAAGERTISNADEVASGAYSPGSATMGEIEPHYYRVLGISRTASQAEVSAAYKRAWNPNRPDIQDVLNAYFVLYDPERRRNYDLNWQDSEPPQFWDEVGIVARLLVVGAILWGAGKIVLWCILAALAELIVACSGAPKAERLVTHDVIDAGVQSAAGWLSIVLLVGLGIYLFRHDKQPTSYPEEPPELPAIYVDAPK
jgi:hypothetical protein